MKVFLVDDEYLIIEMLKRIIDWGALNMEIVGSATNGYDAYDEICRLHPDIVITDIWMPGRDGLELIKNLFLSEIATNYIIISGYKNFEYAQTAMKYGVREYILKPINPKELKESLLRITKKSDCDTKSHMVLPNVSAYEKKVRQMFVSFLMSGFISTSSDFKFINEEYCSHFQEGTFRALVLSLDGEITESFADDTFDHFNTLMKKELGDLCFEQVYSRIDYNEWYILNYTCDNEKKINETLGMLFKKLVQHTCQYSDARVNLGIGKSVKSFTLASETISTCREAILNRILFNDSRVLYFTEDDIDAEAVVQEVFPEADRKALIHDILTVMFDNAKVQIHKIFLSLKSRALKNAQPFLRLSFILFNTFWDSVDFIQQKDHLPQLKDYEFALRESSSVETMQKVCIKYTITCFQNQMDIEEYSGNATVAIVKKYVNNHYSEKISLNDIARVVYLNPVYLSALFKKESGMSFSVFLNEFRMSKAKELLRKVGLPISEVAQKVGMPDPKYFSRTFKKNVGLTPKEFRNKVISIENSRKIGR